MPAPSVEPTPRPPIELRLFVPLEALPQAWRRDLADAARAVVMHESLPRRQDADRHARAEVTRWLQAAAVTALDTVTILGTNDRFVVQAALNRFITALTSSLGPSIVSEVVHHYQASLCSPETRSPAAQVARAVLAAPTERGGR